MWITVIALSSCYTLRVHVVPAALGGFIFGVIFLAVPSLYKWEMWKKITCLVVNMLLNVWSWYLINRFGLGNLNGVKLTGKYKVGHKTIFAKKFGNAVSVWYPIDQGNYATSQRKMYCEGDGLANLTAVGIGAAWISRQKQEEAMGAFMFKHILSIRTEAVTDAPLANDFLSGENKLIPVVFSHGILANREDYQLYGMEMASNGYIVFVLDHLDGLGRYAIKEDGVMPLNLEIPHPSDAWPIGEPDDEKVCRFWYDNIHQRRITEISEVITDLHEELFMSNRLQFGKA